MGVATCSECGIHSALQIFQREAHPSVYKTGQASTKEGLSVYGKPLPPLLSISFKPSYQDTSYQDITSLIRIVFYSFRHC